jgi:hypothetical protein
MSFFGGGGGGGGQSSAPSMQTQIIREAPGIEERKLELMDIARQVAQKPINLPDYQVSGLGALEQQGITCSRYNRCGCWICWSRYSTNSRSSSSYRCSTNKPIFKSISNM